MKKLFKVNDDYVVADSYSNAIEIYLKFYEFNYINETDIKSVELVKNEVIVEE